MTPEQQAVQELREAFIAMLEKAQRERDNLNGSMSARILGLQKELERRDTQVNQVLHLLQGGSNLTREQVIESGLGEGVLIEQRHHEYMRTKAENECGALTAKLESAQCWSAEHKETCVHHTDAERSAAGCPVCLAAKCAKLEACCAEMRERIKNYRAWVGMCNCCNPQTKVDVRVEIEHALSTDCGQALLDELDRMRKALQSIIDGAVHPTTAVRRVMVDLAPIRQALNPKAK